MLFNYVLTHVRIGKISADTANPNKQNVGDYYVTGILKNPSFRRAHGEREIIWTADDPDLVDAVRSVFPKTGKDSDNNDWNGTADIDPSTFVPEDAEKTLRNYRDADWLVFNNGKFIDAKLDGLYCMKYSQDLGTHKKGDWVCDPSGLYVRVWDSVRIFVCMYDEQTEQYVEGWSLKQRMAARLRNMLPLAVAIKQVPDKVDPRYLSQYIIPSVSITTPAPATAPATTPAPAATAPAPEVNEER